MAERQRHTADLSLQERCLAAGGASVVSALVVNPLDVVKTRLQAQATGATSGPAPSVRAVNPRAVETWALAGCTAACQRVVNPAAAVAPACATHCYTYSSALDGLLKITRQEGVTMLWRGTAVSLLMAVPSVGIYLPLYDALASHLAPSLGLYAPLAAGTTARTATMLATAPLELLRTRVQAARGGAGAAGGGVAAQLTSLLAFSPPGGGGGGGGGGGPSGAGAGGLALPALGRRLGAVGGLYRGLGATLARDVPFSAIYWGAVEPIRAGLLRRSGAGGAPSVSQVVAANVAAGGVAGALAAAVTTPLDVVKTQVQVAEGGTARRRLPSLLLQLARTRGVHGLFAGVGARAARTAPSCALVLSSYELLKRAAAGRNGVGIEVLGVVDSRDQTAVG